MKRILVVTDNGLILQKFRALLERRFPEIGDLFEFKRSFQSAKAKLYETGIDRLEETNVKKDWPSIVDRYSLVLSLHCKQVFPADLVKRVRCVNVHPGYNPYNRGWYPQVFAIKDGTILGATIHEMDEEIDRGRIIVRRAVPIKSLDTSLEAYERVIDMEMELLEEYLPAIVDNTYTPFVPENEGVFHTKKEFDELCKLDLNKTMPLGEAINLLRSLTHGGYSNANFVDANGRKVFVGIRLQGEEG